MLVRRIFPISLRYLGSKPDARQTELMAKSLPKQKPIPGVKDIIVVASGKGGVGKSTKAVNLAATLAGMGIKVGLLDADVFGPSVPLMMNLKEEPLIDVNNLMIPPVNYGVKCLSMGLLVQSEPIIWRGPLVMSAVQRLLKGAVWGPLDILIIDTPPGTGDVHLSIAQNVPISGVVLVSTPQTAALEVTARGSEMFKKLKVPVVGIVENMGKAMCKKCGADVELFKNITEKYAKKMETEILESLPMDGDITDSCDNGVPMVVRHPNSEYAKSFKSLSKKVLDFLEKNKNNPHLGYERVKG